MCTPHVNELATGMSRKRADPEHAESSMRDDRTFQTTWSKRCRRSSCSSDSSHTSILEYSTDQYTVSSSDSSVTSCFALTSATSGDKWDDMEDLMHWRAREAQLCLAPNSVMRLQDEVNVAMRVVLVEWMSEVVEEFRLSQETFFLAVNYLDRFLSKQPVSRKQFQLLGTTCLWLAAKYEEVIPPAAQDLVDMSENLYTVQELKDTERHLLAALDFEMGPPTALRFLQYFAMNAQFPENSGMLKFAELLVELSLLDVNSSERLPSHVAAAALAASISTMATFTNHLPLIAEMAQSGCNALLALMQALNVLYMSVTCSGKPCPILERFQMRTRNSMAARAAACEVTALHATSCGAASLHAMIAGGASLKMAVAAACEVSATASAVGPAQVAC